MQKTLVWIAFWLVTVIWPCLAPAAVASSQPSEDLSPRKWAVMLYGGLGTDGGIEEFPLLNCKFNDAYLVDVACSREIGHWPGRVTWEIEGQLAKYFNVQTHGEANLLFDARWKEFPWNDRVRTSVAIGEGVSYATSVPVIEQRRSPNKTSQFLNYLMLELELAPPQDSRWSFFTRIHHRSGVHGLYNGVSLGSNILGAGMRYRF